MLKFNITGDKIQLTSPRSFNSGSKGYYTAEFTFDSDWDGLIPHIVVIENGTQRADEVIIGNIHKIATTESGVMQISVYGLDAEGNKCISCNYVCIEVKQGAYTGAIPLPKDIWEGYQVTVLGYMERAEGAAIDAKASAEAAREAEKNIKNLSATATEGEAVSVTQTMTDEGIRLDFTLPRGKQGEIGPEGPEGPEGPKGNDGADGKDGQDGHTPYIGNNGNWYTFNTETQTFEDSGNKAVVEDAGCELIEEITITEEGIGHIIRSTEPDGTPYNFKEMSVYTEVKPCTVENLVQIKAYDHIMEYNSNNDNNIASFQVRNTTTASGRFILALIGVYGGSWKCFGTGTTLQGSPTSMSMWSGVKPYSKGQTIKTIIINGYTTTLEVGTVIKIYGVRA